MSRSGVVTLLTDFGTHDPYVGVMKGVILTISPVARIVDITHDVPPQAIAPGAYLLAASYRFFPPDSVHLAVVDPGVGSAREAIVARVGQHLFVAPNNGLLSEVLRANQDWEAWEITNSALWLPSVSATFHGRDVFAPAAAHLLSGFPAEEVGPRLDKPAVIQPLIATRSGTELLGHVIWIDRFGNLVTTVRRNDLEWLTPVDAWASLLVSVGSESMRGVLQSYHQGSGLMALVGSTDRLEISLTGGDAAGHLDVSIGDPVVVRT